MRKITCASSLLFAVMVVTGCGGGSHVTSVDKTLIHKTGTLNLSQVRSTSSKLEVRSGSGDWQDMTAASSKDIDTWFKGKSAAESRSFLVFDDFQMPLEDKQVSKAGEITNMQEHLNDRSKAIQDFMKNDKKQLDAREW